MCRSMADIQSTAAEIRRGKKEEDRRRKKLQGKNIMPPLLHRAAIQDRLWSSEGLICADVAAKAGRTRMWANAQRDGRPAEYRWRPRFNATKFG